LELLIPHQLSKELFRLGSGFSRLPSSSSFRLLGLESFEECFLNLIKRLL